MLSGRNAHSKHLGAVRVKPGEIAPHQRHPTDYYPIEQSPMLRFNGNNWATIGNVPHG